MCAHFRSRDRWRSHNSSAISPIPILRENLIALCFTEPELWSINVLHVRIGIFDFWPFLLMRTYTKDPYSLKIYRMCRYELLTSMLSKVIVWQTDKQADTTEIINNLSVDIWNWRWNFAMKWPVNACSPVWLCCARADTRCDVMRYARIS